MSTANESDADVLEALRSYRARISERNKNVCKALIAFVHGDRTHPELGYYEAQEPPEDMTPEEITRAKFNFVAEYLGLPDDQRDVFHAPEELLEIWDWLAPRCSLDGTSSSISFNQCVVDRESYKRGIMAGLQGLGGSAVGIPFPQNLWVILGEIGQLHGPNWTWSGRFPQGPGITCMIDLDGTGEAPAEESVITADKGDFEFRTWEDFETMLIMGGGMVEVLALIWIGDTIALDKCYLVYSRPILTCTGRTDCPIHGDGENPPEAPWGWRWAMDLRENGILAMENTAAMLEHIGCFDYGDKLDSVWAMNVDMELIYDEG